MYIKSVVYCCFMQTVIFFAAVPLLGASHWKCEVFTNVSRCSGLC